MSTPDRAPRRTAAQMSINVASGTPVPGVNKSTYTRQAVSSDGMKEGKTYDNQRSAGKSGMTPTSFPDTKANK